MDHFIYLTPSKSDNTQRCEQQTETFASSKQRDQLDTISVDTYTSGITWMKLMEQLGKKCDSATTPRCTCVLSYKVCGPPPTLMSDHAVQRPRADVYMYMTTRPGGSDNTGCCSHRSSQPSCTDQSVAPLH